MNNGIEAYRVLVIDDHPIVCEGLRGLIAQKENTLCVGVSDKKSLEASFAGRFDLYITDLEFPDVDMGKLVIRLRNHAPRCSILVYTMHDEPWVAAKLSDWDIDGAVSKNSDINELHFAIAALREGRRYFDRALAPCRSLSPFAVPDFSRREKEVLDCLARGMNTAEIADSLFISLNTVKTHRRHLMEKFDAKNVAQLIAKWKRWSL